MSACACERRFGSGGDGRGEARFLPVPKRIRASRLTGGRRDVRTEPRARALPGEGLSEVVSEFLELLGKNPDMAVAVAAIKALASVVRKSQAQTIMGLEKELSEAAQALTSCSVTAISLKAGCELFMCYVTRTSFLESEDLGMAKARLIERSEAFADISLQAREKIARLAQKLIYDGCTILVHGYSRVVVMLLKRAAATGMHFNVYCTEGRPDSTGITAARVLKDLSIPVTVILDSAAAFILERCSMVLVGAEGVVENGGIINKLGTYQIALAAKALKKHVYVAAESYKFARLYPLNQRDLPMESKPVDFGPLLPPQVKINNPSRDYTPPEYLSLLITDLGILTPSAVSDELIQLYL